MQVKRMKQMRMRFLSLIVLVIPIWVFVSSGKKVAEARGIILGHGHIPNFTKDQSNHLHVVYGSNDSIMYAASSDGGSSFSRPVLVDTLNKLFSFAMRGPQIACVGNKVVIIASNQYGNIYSYQKDGMGKWEETGRVNNIDTMAKEGFLALGGDGSTFVFAAWLDTRNNNNNNIYGAKSIDGGKTWSKNINVYRSPDGHVCECCKPSVVANNNHVYVMFRNWVDGNRDLYLVHSTDAGGTFGKGLKLGKNNWPLKGCPMDGGGVVIDGAGNPKTVWRREGKIFACSPGKQEIEIGEGRSCTLALAGGKVIYSWVENGNIVCLLPGNRKVIMGKGKLPSLLGINNTQVICVWEEEGKIMSGRVGV